MAQPLGKPEESTRAKERRFDYSMIEEHHHQKERRWVLLKRPRCDIDGVGEKTLDQKWDQNMRAKGRRVYYWAGFPRERTDLHSLLLQLGRHRTSAARDSVTVEGATKRIYGFGSARLSPSTAPLSPARASFSDVVTKVVCCGL